jgi:hypothetical protein
MTVGKYKDTKVKINKTTEKHSERLYEIAGHLTNLEFQA